MDSNDVLTQSMLQGAASRNAYCSRKVLTLIFFLLGLGFAALLMTMPGTSVEEEPIINMALGKLRPTGPQQFRPQLATAWSLPRVASVWQPMQPARRKEIHGTTSRNYRVPAAKNIHFNEGGKGEMLNKMEVGVRTLAKVVGVTLGPKGRNVVLRLNFGTPKVVNDGATIAKEVKIQDPLGKLGAAIVKEAASKTNDLAGDGTTTATILSWVLISEGIRIVAAGANPVLVSRGIDETLQHLLTELTNVSRAVSSSDLKDVATVSAGGNEKIGKMVSDAMNMVGASGIVNLEDSKTAEDTLIRKDGMQFDRGYMSPYFITDRKRLVVEFEKCKLLLVDRRINSARELIPILESAMTDRFPLFIIAEDIDADVLSVLIVNKLRNNLQVAAVRAPGFGERKSSYLQDIAILTGAKLIGDAMGTEIETSVPQEILGDAAKVTVGKDQFTIVSDGSSNTQVNERVNALRKQLSVTDSDFEKEKLTERIAKLVGGVAVIQVGANTEAELNEKKLRVEDAIQASKSAVEEGIVAGGGTTMLRLSKAIDTFQATMDNEEKKLGAEILKLALKYPIRLIASNAGAEGVLVANEVLKSTDPNFGFNAATGTFEDMLTAGIIDPTKVVRCGLESAASVAKTFLMADAALTKVQEKEDKEKDSTHGGDEELVFFNDGGKGEALKKMVSGSNQLAKVVGVTLGPKGRNVVLESDFGGPPRVVNDGVTIGREVEFEDPLEDIGAKLVIQAAQKTNELAGDGTTTATVLSDGMITEGVRVVALGANPVSVIRGMEKCVDYLVSELKKLSKEVADGDLKDVATVSAGGNERIGSMVSDAMLKVGRNGVVTLEEGKTSKDDLHVVEGMQFDRGYLSPHFITDKERMVAEYTNCKVVLVDKKLSFAGDLVDMLESSVKGNFPVVIIAEDVADEALGTLVANKLRGVVNAVAVKAPGFGARKTEYLEDIAVLTGGQVVGTGSGVEVMDDGAMGHAAKITVSKDSITIVGDGSTAQRVEDRIQEIKTIEESADSEYEITKLTERIAKLAGGVAVIEVGGQTEGELTERKLRVEDALRSTKAAVEEGIVAGGGTTMLRLSKLAEAFKDTVSDQEEKRGVEIIAKALLYPLDLIARNAGDEGSLVTSKVMELDDPSSGYNAATGEICNLIKAGIVDPTKVVRCCLENAASVAKTFLVADAVVVQEQDKSAPGDFQR